MGHYSNQRYACPDCDSSDGLAVNNNGSAYCHACPEEDAYKSKGRVDLDNLGEPAVNTDERPYFDRDKVVNCTDFRAFPERGITVDTVKFFGVNTTPDGLVVFHYGKDAVKIRFPDKDFTAVGSFKEAPLFGQGCFNKPKGGGKFVSKLTICEGEFDAMAAYQMQGSKYPCVSVKNGASGAVKDCKRAFEWMDSFDEIIVCFDGDAPGIKAAAQVAKLFGDKASVMKHPQKYKDACDYLAAGDKTAFTQAFWNAEQYTPDDIVPSSQLREAVLAPVQMPFCSYPWDGLNLKCYGMRRGEIVTILAGSGVGKSTFTKALLNEVLESTQEKIGVLSLEESNEVSALKMMSMHSKKLFHLPTVSQMKAILKDPTRIVEKSNLDDVTDEQRLADKLQAFEDTLSTNRFYFLKHEGHITMESVARQMRFLAKSQECKVILLDHVSILVGLTAQKQGNMVDAIDTVMHNLRTLVEETDITLINISHLRKTSEGKSHEEGGRVRAVDARGSGSIIQLSDIGLALEGNRQSEDARDRNITVVRVLKNRFSGETGVACHLLYDESTGIMSETKQIDLEEAL